MRFKPQNRTLHHRTLYSFNYSFKSRYGLPLNIFTRRILFKSVRRIFNMNISKSIISIVEANELDLENIADFLHNSLEHEEDDRGAVKYLVAEFDLSQKQAFNIVKAWNKLSPVERNRMNTKDDIKWLTNQLSENLSIEKSYQAIDYLPNDSDKLNQTIDQLVKENRLTTSAKEELLDLAKKYKEARTEASRFLIEKNTRKY